MFGKTGGHGTAALHFPVITASRPCSRFRAPCGPGGTRVGPVAPTSGVRLEYQIRAATAWDAAGRIVGYAGIGPNRDDADECEFDSRHPGHVNFAWTDGLAEELFSAEDLTTQSQVPEPNSVLLLGTGVLAAAGVVRRRFAK